jgi:hypothetical protein
VCAGDERNLSLVIQVLNVAIIYELAAGLSLT